jgi:hypothetical protein
MLESYARRLIAKEGHPAGEVDKMLHPATLARSAMGKFTRDFAVSRLLEPISRETRQGSPELHGDFQRACRCWFPF